MFRAVLCSSSGGQILLLQPLVSSLSAVQYALKKAPTCFDLNQIIFRELIYSLLKSLILKFVKNVKSYCGEAAA